MLCCYVNHICGRMAFSGLYWYFVHFMFWFWRGMGACRILYFVEIVDWRVMDNESRLEVQECNSVLGNTGNNLPLIKGIKELELGRVFLRGDFSSTEYNRDRVWESLRFVDNSTVSGIQGLRGRWVRRLPTHYQPSTQTCWSRHTKKTTHSSDSSINFDSI